MSDQIGAALREQVKIYCEKYRHPKLPPFVVCDPHSMTSWYGTPEADKPGCYVYYSQDGDVLYIGKASMTRRIGHRLHAHDHREPRAQWWKKAKVVQFVNVSEPFEAPSLEEFLLTRLTSDGNIRKVRSTPDPSN